MTRSALIFCAGTFSAVILGCGPTLAPSPVAKPAPSASKVPAEKAPPEKKPSAATDKSDKATPPPPHTGEREIPPGE